MTEQQSTFTPERKWKGDLSKIPKLKLESKVLIEAQRDVRGGVDTSFYLGKKHKTHSFNEEYFFINAPTLAELNCAYFGQDENGKWISPEFRDVWKRDVGESHTSTFLYKREELVELPELIYRSDRFGWRAEGGKRTKIEVPYSGWVVEYDKDTGWPVETSEDFDKAEQNFGDDVSHFDSSIFYDKYRNFGDLVQISVWRGADAKFGGGRGPFEISLGECSVSYIESFPDGVTSLPCQRIEEKNDFTLYRIINYHEMLRFQKSRARMRGEKGLDFT